MKKLDLGQTITILANVGVIAGIIFLGLELRQNNELQVMQARETRLDRQNSVIDLMIENPDIIELLGKNPESLTEAEHDRLQFSGLKIFLAFEYQYGEVVRGLTDEDALARAHRAIYFRPRMNYGAPLTWELFKKRTSPEFIRWFEENVIQAGPVE